VSKIGILTDDPLYADRRNFYKVRKWIKHGQRIEGLLVGANSVIAGEGIRGV
jgi:hypothetical protein